MAGGWGLFPKSFVSIVANEAVPEDLFIGYRRFNGSAVGWRAVPLVFFFSTAAAAAIPEGPFIE